MSEITLSPTRAIGRRSAQVRLVAALLPVGMGVMVVVDHLLGDRAEYFHAGKLLTAWWRVLSGRGVDSVHFIAGQEEMGDTLALVVGSATFVLEPAIVLAAAVVGVGAVARRIRPGRRG